MRLVFQTVFSPHRSPLASCPRWEVSGEWSALDCVLDPCPASVCVAGWPVGTGDDVVMRRVLFRFGSHMSPWFPGPIGTASVGRAELLSDALCDPPGGSCHRLCWWEGKGEGSQTCRRQSCWPGWDSGQGSGDPGPSSHPRADFQRRPGVGGGSWGCAGPRGTETGALRCQGMSYALETYHPVFLSPTPSHLPRGAGCSQNLTARSHWLC